MLRLALLSILVIVVPGAFAEPLLTLKAEASWNRLLKPDSTSEVAITLMAARGGKVTVTLPDHQPRLRLETGVEPLQPRTLWLSVHPVDGAPLTIEAQLEGDEVVRDQITFTGLPDTARLIVNTLPANGTAATENDSTLLLDSSLRELPRTEGGYGGIDAVILDQTMLATLDERQMMSLKSYLSGCGRIVLIGSSTPLDREIAALGCGSGYITVTVTPEEALAAARVAAEFTVGELPSANRLAELGKLNSQSNLSWRPLLIFFILYIAALVLLGRRSRSMAPVLLLPLLASLLGWTAWSNDRAERRLVSWSETVSGGQSARYSALLDISGNGRGGNTIVLPPLLAEPQPQSLDHEAELLWQEEGDGSRQLRVTNHLLAHQEYLLQGSMTLRPLLSLRMNGQTPVVENRGTTTSPPALLGWSDKRHPLPALQPGEQWTPTEQQGTPWNVNRPEEQLLRNRTQEGNAALLLPHTLLPGRAGTQEIEEQGWLLITSS